MKKPYARIALAFTLALLFACAREAVEELPHDELFSLGIGKMDSQVDLFQVNGVMAAAKNRIYMRDGLFYIANGNSAKIMQLSSYGDLIFLLYNAEENPPPVLFPSESQDSNASTRTAVAYPLRRIGELAVDSEKRIYVEDAVSPQRQVQDKELRVVLDRVVLRFDRHGKLLDFIGQEGVGGTPFAYIDALHVTDRDELVVICRTPRLWQVFWYSPEGSLRFQAEIDHERLPIPDARPEAVPSLSKIVPDPQSSVLYLLVHYQVPEGEDAAQSYFTRIYALQLSSGTYTAGVEVPQDGSRLEKVGTQEVEVAAPSFELLGVSSDGLFYLLRRDEANVFQLLLLDPGGKELARRYLVMQDAELFYKEVRLSATGIIYALLAEEFRARMVWWRSDRLVDGGGM